METKKDKKQALPQARTALPVISLSNDEMSQVTGGGLSLN